ncbi:PaaI family thioesterase [Segnochrobactraceae bacterium EtOH-i3]
METSVDYNAIVEGRAAPPPSARLLGWRHLGFDTETGTLTVSFEATEDFLNPAGMVQGGMLAAMLDDTLGPVASAVSGGALFAQTLEMKVSYLRPGRVGTIFAEGRIVRQGREILFLEGRLYDADGKTIATATATARAVRPA